MRRSGAFARTIAQTCSISWPTRVQSDGSSGVDPGFGARLAERLQALGFEAVRGVGRLHLFRGGTEPRSAHMPALAEIRDLLVAAGRVTAPEYDAFLTLADDPRFLWRESLLMSVQGRRPARSAAAAG